MALHHFTPIAITTQYFLTCLVVPNAYNIEEHLFATCLLAQAILHPLFFYLFLAHIKIENQRLYGQLILRTRVPLTVLIHVLSLLSFFVRKDILLGMTVNLLYGVYWREHVTTLQNVNRALMRE